LKCHDLRRTLQPIVELGGELNCTLIGIHHQARNSAERHAVSRLLGSQAFTAAGFVVIYPLDARAGLWRDSRLSCTSLVSCQGRPRLSSRPGGCEIGSTKSQCSPDSLQRPAIQVRGNALSSSGFADPSRQDVFEMGSGDFRPFGFVVSQVPESESSPHGRRPIRGTPDLGHPIAIILITYSPGLRTRS